MSRPDDQPAQPCPDATTASRRPHVGILLFDDVEVLDFAGPCEVCSGTLDPGGHPCVDVVTVGTGTPVRARGGLRVQPDHGLADCPPLDVREQARSTPTHAPVCTGASLLGRAGLLSGHRATTHTAASTRSARSSLTSRSWPPRPSTRARS